MIDEELLRALAYFHEQLEEMAVKFQQLKDVTYKLSRENQKLQEENLELKKLVFDKKANVPGKSFQNLMHLYREGYHICHPSFGERRKGDCLFCLQIINSQSKE